MTTFIVVHKHKKEFVAAMKSADRYKVEFKTANGYATALELMKDGFTGWTATNALRTWFASVTVVKDGYKGLRLKIE